MLDRNTFVGPWAGLPTAWNDDDTFDELSYRQDVRACCEAGVAGVYTHGSTGEFYAMDIDEWQAVSRACAEECQSMGTPFMLGCTATSTRGVIRRAIEASGLGADAIQIALPFWYQMPDLLVVPFFGDVSAAVPTMAISIYETARCKKTLTLDQHRAIHEAVPNYLMVKSTTGTLGFNEDGCAALSKFVNVFTGEHDWARLGPHGVIGASSSLFYANPRYINQMWKLLRAKRYEQLGPMCSQLLALDEKALAHLPDTYHDSAYDRLLGLLSGFLRTSMKCRGPYPSTNEVDIEKVKQWCRDNFPEFLQL